MEALNASAEAVFLAEHSFNTSVARLPLNEAWCDAAMSSTLPM